ncbi:MAG: iron-containing alcohol dehydrogenase [bacterium]|nr:iron-containing alcohol dehydrogenase [bacterium]
MIEEIPDVRKFVAPEFIFGIGARKLVGRYVKNFGARKIMLVTDPEIEKAGWVKDIGTSLEQTGIPYIIYNTVTPNPKEEEVMAGVDIYKSKNCNLIVCLGGGSVIDCAKGIGIVVSNGKHILDYEGVDIVTRPMPPLICIPTTGGASADVSQFCIITNQQERVKIAIISKAVVPDVALIDPFLLTTMDLFLTACTGMDALVHGIEAYVSNASSHATDLHALEGIKLISHNIEKSIANPGDIQLREKIMQGSLQTGLAFSNASLGGIHAMAHSLGGFKDLPHGECNSILLRHVVDFNFSTVPEKFLKIGEVMGLNLRGMPMVYKKRRILKKIERMLKKVGIVNTLGSHGISSADIASLAKKALDDACIVTNPRKANKRDIEVLYEEAL